jgi:hypothetical protein
MLANVGVSLAMPVLAMLTLSEYPIMLKRLVTVELDDLQS